jgi:hypothetical protein
MQHGLQMAVVYNETWCFDFQSASITPSSKVNGITPEGDVSGGNLPVGAMKALSRQPHRLEIALRLASEVWNQCLFRSYFFAYGCRIFYCARLGLVRRRQPVLTARIGVL